MGKGNRSRIERAMNESANAEKKVQAKKNKVSGAGIFVAVAAILVVVALLIGAIGVVNDSGWFARSQTAVKTENFKVDGSMMNYFYSTQFNNIYQYYYQMFQSYASSGLDVNSLVYQQMGITDPSKSLKDQNMKVAEGADPITVFDFYMNQTEDYVTRLLTYCEFAVKEGIELTAEEKEEIEHSIEHMKESYKSQKAMYEQFGMAYYSSFSAYLAANYGTGVKERDVIKCLELITLAAKFEEQLTEEKKQEILGDKANTAVEEFVKENPSAFLMADYYAYSFTVNNKGKTDAEFEAEKAELLEKAKKLAEATDKAAYKEAVLALLEEAELKSYRDKNWATFLKDNENDETKTEEAIKKSFYEKIWTDANKDLKFNATLKEAYKYPTTPTDLSKWIFGYEATACNEGKCDHKKDEEHEKDQEAAKVGDITYIEDATEREETVKKEETTTAGTTGATTEEPTTDAAAPAAETTTQAPSSSTTNNKIKVTTYTVTVYLLEKETYRNTEITKNFGYVMFASKADAEKFYEEFKKGEMNKDTLVDLIEDMHEEVSPYAYDAAEDYLQGDLEDQKVTGADKWLKDAKAGDCSGVIELVYSTTKTVDGKPKDDKKTYYSILVYDGEGYEAWYCDALNGATGEAVSDWYEENALKPEYNEKAYRFINA